MGERLVLEIRDAGTPKANAYYHWSGFTSTALRIAETAVVALLDGATPVEALERTGAGDTNRNDGLIEINRREMAYNLSWAEETIILDTDSQTADVSGAFDLYDRDAPDKLLAIPFSRFSDWRVEVETRKPGWFDKCGTPVGFIE